MKLKFGMKKKSSDMLVLYITVGIVFVLITAMNIYAYSKIRSMSSDYTSFGEISKGLRHDLDSAENNLAEIVLKGKSLDLKKHVYSHLEKAHSKAKELGQISNLKLDKNIRQFETLAPEAYSEKSPAVKKQKMDQCSRLVKNAVDRLNASDEERTSLIQNDACVPPRVSGPVSLSSQHLLSICRQERRPPPPHRPPAMAEFSSRQQWHLGLCFLVVYWLDAAPSSYRPLTVPYHVAALTGPPSTWQLTSS